MTSPDWMSRRGNHSGDDSDRLLNLGVVLSQKRPFLRQIIIYGSRSFNSLAIAFLEHFLIFFSLDYCSIWQSNSNQRLSLRQLLVSPPLSTKQVGTAQVGALQVGTGQVSGSQINNNF